MNEPPYPKDASVELPADLLVLKQVELSPEEWQAIQAHQWVTGKSASRVVQEALRWWLGDGGEAARVDSLRYGKRRVVKWRGVSRAT